MAVGISTMIASPLLQLMICPNVGGDHSAGRLDHNIFDPTLLEYLLHRSASRLPEAVGQESLNPEAGLPLAEAGPSITLPITQGVTKFRK